MNRDRRSLYLKFDTELLEQGLVPAKALAAILNLMPMDTKLVRVFEDGPQFDPYFRDGGNAPVFAHFRFTSSEFEEISENCAYPELLAEFNSVTNEVTLTVNGRTPAWLRKKAPRNPEPPRLEPGERVVPWLQSYGVITKDGGQLIPTPPTTCQCDVAYLGGHWPHCKRGHR